MNIDGNAIHQYAQGGIIAIISIAMVFLILLLIIVLTELVTKVAGNKEAVAESAPNTVTYSNVSSKLNVNDEDAVVACVVASIDYRNETKKNIQVISVKEG